ncbi:MAG: dipeptidase [Clostridia bacterium]|jgi:membrane dipeptidase|nr:dipeptidase [Clostridia bacterium]
MDDLIIVDGHCDTVLEYFKHKRSFWEKNKKGQMDWPRLREARVGLQFLAFYIEPEYKPAGSLARVLEMLSFFRFWQEEAPEGLQVIRSREDLSALHPDRTAFLLAIEGGEVLEGRTSLLRILHELGFRSLGLTWNQRNLLADGAWENASKGGLTRHGTDTVREMNKLGMLIDVSHLADAGFWDVLAVSEKPVAATHSCCRALMDHPRNLTDEQLAALGRNNGIIGINFFPGFLSPGKAGISNVVSHLEHAAAIAGIDHIGLGSDFDGINRTPAGLEDVTKIAVIPEALLQRGWKEAEVRKIMGGNFIRVLSDVLP